MWISLVVLSVLVDADDVALSLYLERNSNFKENVILSPVFLRVECLLRSAHLHAT